MECHLSLQTRKRRILQAISDLASGLFHSRDRNLKYDYFLDAQTLTRFCWWKPANPETSTPLRTETFAKLQALKTEFCDTATIDKFDY